MMHSASAEHQNYQKEFQESEHYHYKLGISATYINFWGVGEKHDEENRKILSWLSPDDFECTHEGHLRKRFEKTGQWLLDDPRFISWKNGPQSSLLWCHGARK